MAQKKKERTVIAILTADWHLSHRPPIWRSNEPDWYEAMGRPVGEILSLAGTHECPVIMAGDIFDKWNSPPELINWLMDTISNHHVSIFAIPGQHDMPNHNPDEMDKSAFRTLTKSCLIHEPCNNKFPNFADYFHPGVELLGFGFGSRPTFYGCHSDRKISVAVIHDYVWTKGHSYPGAPADKRLPDGVMATKSINAREYRFYGYDVVIYGDNHSGFMKKIGHTTVFNCGTIMRRKRDEEEYRPQVGILYTDGSIEPHYLSLAGERHLTAEESKDSKREELDIEDIAAELRKLGASALDFAEALEQYCAAREVPDHIVEIIRKAIEKGTLRESTPKNG